MCLNMLGAACHKELYEIARDTWFWRCLLCYPRALLELSLINKRVSYSCVYLLGGKCYRHFLTQLGNFSFWSEKGKWRIYGKRNWNMLLLLLLPLLPLLDNYHYYYYYYHHHHHLFMQGIYTYIPETNYVPREYSVAAILLFLFMMFISLVSVLNLLYFYISVLLLLLLLWVPGIFPGGKAA